MKSALLAAAALALAGTGLASCGDSRSEPDGAPSGGAPEAPAGINVTNARLVLPAVKGNPGAVYFDLANGGKADTAIAGIFVDGARAASLHTTMKDGDRTSMVEMSNLPVARGAAVQFAPGGNHGMAMEIDAALQPGDTTEVTLTFADGDKVSFPAKVLSAGEAR